MSGSGVPARDPLEAALARADSPLVGPEPLAHSQELAEGLPAVRRRVGPAPWYRWLEDQTRRQGPRT